MTTHKNTITRLADIAASLPGLITKLDATRNELAARMGTLQRDGLIYATEHMKDGKYLVLLHPIKNGGPRRREYVGKDPRKVQAARDSIRRTKEYDELLSRSQQLDRLLANAYNGMKEVVSELSISNSKFNN